MDATEFLKHVWPPGPGFFCIATPGGEGRQGYKQLVSASIEDAARAAMHQSLTTDVFFNIHVLKEPKVFDAAKKNWDGSIGGWRVRVGTNMRGAICLFCDVDVGPDKPYKTRDAALAALAAFLLATGLPRPTVVSSGVGLHCYWPFDRELPVDAWRELAQSFKLLMAKCSFHVDPVRTTDVSSVLRVVGTKHRKDPNNVRDVEVLGDLGERTPVERLMHLIDMAHAGTTLVRLPPRGSMFAVDPANLPKGDVPDWYAKPPTLAELGKACAQVRLVGSPRGQQTVQSEPVWYYVGLNTTRWTAEGREACHAISNRHPDYTYEATEAKLDQLESVAGGNMGPTTCAKIAAVAGDDLCIKCQFYGHPKSSPIAHARNLPKDKDATETALGICDPPHPYTRLGKGGIRYAPLDGDPPRNICEHDLYPLRLIHNEEEKRTETMWALALPLRGIREFIVPADTYSDSRKLEGLLRNQGLFAPFENYKYIREYMSAYIAQLQQHMRDSKQRGHLGWTKDYEDFILPEYIVTGGEHAPVSLNANVITASSAIRKSGTLAKQVELLKFYNHIGYERQQFFSALGLAAPLLHATGHHGVLVNMSGESGASKSTSLYTGASFWGDPEPFTINGTNDGATIRARNERASLMSNLPVCVDEITKMEKDAASNLAFSITQEGGRLRLNQDGTERAKIAVQKSTFMMTTSNTSLHELLASGNATATASSMRVFEIPTPQVTIHDKREADDYLRELKANYGHVGPAWIDHLTRHRKRLVEEVIDMGRDIDKRGKVAQHERFWSATIATNLVTIREANKLGILPFDYSSVEAWALHHLNVMRASVDANYIDPVDCLLGYIASIITNLMLVRDDARGITVIRTPRTELQGRYDLTRKTLFITHQALRHYCTRYGISLLSMTHDLKKRGIATSDRISLGKGHTDWNVGQHPVLAIDMRHQAMAGVNIEDADLDAVEDGKVVSIKTGRK